MKKCVLLIALLTLSQLNLLRAQSLFSAPGTVCINQPVTLVPDSLALNAMSYYWGFCSGYLMNAPTGLNIGDSFSFHIPTNIDIVYDSGNYYGFAINSRTTEFLRLNYGSSLNNIPTVTNFGNLTNGLPVNPTSLYIVRDTFSAHWFVFVCGGFEASTSTLGRIDFGSHLNNPAPNIANFGNYTGMLNYPTGLFVAQDLDGTWSGFLVNHVTGDLIHLDFSFNVSNTPLMFDYGNLANVITSPTDLAAIKDNGNWYLFITNEGVGSDIVRVDLGTGLFPSLTAIAGTAITDALNSPSFNSRILEPSSITLNRDCGNLYAYVTDSTTSQLIGITMSTVTGPYNAVDYNNVGLMNKPSSISSILRDKDDLYGFILNARDSSLTQVSFQQCHNSSIPSFTELNPPVYIYDSPGVYNVYLVINQGLPNMVVSCKTITVLPYPPIYMNNDTTLCEGDTIRLYATSNLADSIIWQSTYNIDTSYLYGDSVRVFPDYSFRYPVILYYSNGCIVDTAVNVNVSIVKADAGPDRWILDGATTTLGGPFTSTGNYLYNWSPFQYMSDSTVTNPVVKPPYDYTYYLTVTELNDTFRCQAKDTVVVQLDCGNVYLPNAFAPNSTSSLVNRYMLLNAEIVKLNTFQIFDRWGIEVFETTDPTQGWDGTFNGKPAPQDVYVWQVDAYCLSGKHFKRSGNVTLIR